LGLANKPKTATAVARDKRFLMIDFVCEWLAGSKSKAVGGGVDIPSITC
jgi:hypothetical protein